MPLLLADFIHARVCKPKCEKLLTLPASSRNLKYRFIVILFEKVLGFGHQKSTLKLSFQRAFFVAWANRIDTFGNSWKTGLFGVINCCQASSDQILCQNTYSFHLNYSMYKEKTQHFYFKLSFSTSPFFAGLLTLLPLPLEEFFGSTFFRVIEVFSHPTVFLVDFRNDTIGQNLNNDILSD